MREEIKDDRNRVIGKIERYPNGSVKVFSFGGSWIGELKPEGSMVVAEDKHFHKIAYWDSRNNTTYDYQSRREIGKGNLLVDMILSQE